MSERLSQPSVPDALPTGAVPWVHHTSILTPTSGFLRAGYTHTCNPYVGCAFAQALCGTYCYAQHNRWITHGRPWGLYGAKRDVREAYRRDYARVKRPRRGAPQPLKIYMSSSTDPYLPQERRLGLTHALLEEMVQQPPDVLVVQTRSPLIGRDHALLEQLAARCTLWVSVTVETDMAHVPGFPPQAASPTARLAVLRRFREAGVQTQATISPLLPLADPRAFAQALDVACTRVILDHYLLGDGSPGGWRTQHTDFVQRLAQAGYAAWATLETFEATRVTLVGVLGLGRVLISRAGFNAV